MGKSIVCFLICFSIAQPVIVSAAALERYSVPQPVPRDRVQTDMKTRSGYVDRQVYEQFKSEIQGYDQEKKKELERQFRAQARQAVREGNKDALLHYQRLIDILNTSK
jgi:hypothetical protein